MKKITNYYVDSIKDKKKTYYLIRQLEDDGIVIEPTRYLAYKTKTNCSPKTVNGNAHSLRYYLDYLDEKDLTINKVMDMKFDKQQIHFIGFLEWLKQGGHLTGTRSKLPGNETCNIHLRTVFGWYQFMEIQNEQFGTLKVLKNRVVSFANSKGVRMSTMCRMFRGYLPESEHYGRSIERDSIMLLLESCTNVRDQLLLLLMAETGFRIGEILGIRYGEDIDYSKKLIRVCFREGNENDARAKYAENRHARISDATFEVLLFYLSEYRKLLMETEYLFVVLEGENRGKPLKYHAVSSLFKRLKEKTGILATPHMLRHYFANERRRDGWEMALISQALGHKHISTTEQYLNIDDEELIAAMDLYYQETEALLDIT